MSNEHDENTFLESIRTDIRQLRADQREDNQALQAEMRDSLKEIKLAIAAHTEDDKANFEALTRQVQTLTERNAIVDAVEGNKEKRWSKYLGVAGFMLSVMMILVMAFGPWHFGMSDTTNSTQTTTSHTTHR